MRILKKILTLLKWQVLAACLAFISAGTTAQQISFREADSLTYALYIAGNWDALITTAHEAIDNGHDYYYMRLRLGMAWYHKNKFRIAARELETALKFNSSDTFALKHLYYCYRFSGRDADAWLLSRDFPEHLKSSLGLTNKVFVNGIYAEGGYIFSNSTSKMAGTDFDDRKNIYGEADLTGNYSYIHLGIKHPVTKFLNIYHAYTNLSIGKEKIMQHNDTSRKDDYYMLQQNQYYIQATFDINRKWLIIPAFHYLNVRYSPLYAGFDTTNGYTYTQVDQKLNDYVAFAGISREFGYVSAGISGSYSQLNNKTYIQGNINFNVFPLGNLDLYALTTVSGLLERNKPGQGNGSGPGPSGKKPEFVFSETIGSKVFRKLYSEVSFVYGDISGYNEKNAFLVNNIPDHTKYRAGISLIYCLSKNIDIGVYFLYTEKEDSYFYYQDINNNPNSIITNNYNYHNNTITGGIKWKL